MVGDMGRDENFANTTTFTFKPIPGVLKEDFKMSVQSEKAHSTYGQQPGLNKLPINHQPASLSIPYPPYALKNGPDCSPTIKPQTPWSCSKPSLANTSTYQLFMANATSSPLLNGRSQTLDSEDQSIGLKEIEYSRSISESTETKESQSMSLEQQQQQNAMLSNDAEGVWSPDIEQSFQEALAIYPPCGRRKIILSDEGKMYGRNELIARYIKLRTGKTRTRKQVSSHIQVLARKKSRENQTPTQSKANPDSSSSRDDEDNMHLDDSSGCTSSPILLPGFSHVLHPINHNTSTLTSVNHHPNNPFKSPVHSNQPAKSTSTYPQVLQFLHTTTVIDTKAYNAQTFKGPPITSPVVKPHNDIGHSSVGILSMAPLALRLPQNTNTRANSDPYQPLKRPWPAVENCLNSSLVTKPSSNGSSERSQIPPLPTLNSFLLSEQPFTTHPPSYHLYYDYVSRFMVPHCLPNQSSNLNNNIDTYNANNAQQISQLSSKVVVQSLEDNVPQSKLVETDRATIGSHLELAFGGAEGKCLNFLQSPMLKLAGFSCYVENLVLGQMSLSDDANNNSAPEEKRLKTSPFTDTPTQNKTKNDVFLRRHLFVQIEGGILCEEPTFEKIEVKQIHDKFPGLKELFEKGPRNAFYLVKFWGDVDVDIRNDPNVFYGIDSLYESEQDMTITCSTKVCSFGKQVVEKVETEYSRYENGRFVYRINRSPLCEYMINFILKLIRLPEKYMMNSVLENFTILQVVTNRDTNETLLCIAYVFEVSMNENGAQKNVYSLVDTLFQGDVQEENGTI